MQTTFFSLVAAFTLLGSQCLSQPEQASALPVDRPTILIRCDDIGMCHTVNLAFKQVLETGLPVSASVMVVCPWYQEAVDILKQHPEVAVGVHLTLNAEWKNYRWGPVAGWKSVPTLTDSLGYFFPSRALFFAHDPSLPEVERELRAQLDRAFASGLHIDYVDYHMGTAVDRLEMRELVERLAKEYRVGISRYFGEQDVGGVYSAPIEAKTDTLLERLPGLTPGAVHLMVFHIGLDTPEMEALVDLNPFGLSNVGKQRQAELGALTSPEFRRTLEARNICATTYRGLVQMVGIDRMHRPK
jgi:chitin disaccharide deacetylase